MADIGALPQGDVRMDCRGSALHIREHRGTVFIETHGGPSSGCIVVLSSALSYKAALSGWLLGLMGTDYAIVRGSEIHFLSVQPLHILVYDLNRNSSVEVYPVKDDARRRRFSRAIRLHVSQKWCYENNAQCDPENFDTDLTGAVEVNESARVFGFEARFDAAGFGDDAEKHVPQQNVVYLFRERGTWEHRELEPGEIRTRFGVTTVRELVAKNPDAAFEKSPPKRP